MLLEISQPASHVRIHANLRVKIFSITTPSKKYVKIEHAANLATWQQITAGTPQVEATSTVLPFWGDVNMSCASAKLHQQQAYTNA